MLILVTVLKAVVAHYAQPQQQLQPDPCTCPPVTPCPPPPLPPPPPPPCLPPPCPPQFCPPPPLCPPPQPIVCPPPCPPPPPPCPPMITCPAPPPCPLYCPPSPPCPLPVPCPLPCPPAPPPPPCPPAAAPPTFQHYATGPTGSSNSYQSGQAYTGGEAESYRGSYSNQPAGDGYVTNGIDGPLLADDFTSARKISTTGETIPMYRVTPEPDSLFGPSQQQPKDSPGGYLPGVISENTQQQPSQEQDLLIQTNGRLPPSPMRSIAEGARIATHKSTTFLIKTDCALNGSNCGHAVDFTVPPENDCCTNCSAPCRFRRLRTVSLATDQLQEVDPICNSELLRQIITEQSQQQNTGNDSGTSSKVKIRIQRAARRHLDGLFGVICGTGDFAYIIQTNEFCQHRTGNITCYVFRPFSAEKVPTSEKAIQQV